MLLWMARKAGCHIKLVHIASDVHMRTNHLNLESSFWKVFTKSYSLEIEIHGRYSLKRDFARCAPLQSTPLVSLVVLYSTRRRTCVHQIVATLASHRQLCFYGDVSYIYMCTVESCCSQNIWWQRFTSSSKNCKIAYCFVSNFNQKNFFSLHYIYMPSDRLDSPRLGKQTQHTDLYVYLY